MMDKVSGNLFLVETLEIKPLNLINHHSNQLFCTRHAEELRNTLCQLQFGKIRHKYSSENVLYGGFK